MSPLTIDDIHIELTRKRIKNMHLRVLAPHGRVTLSAPFHVSESDIQSFLLRQMPWIRNQQERIHLRPALEQKNYRDKEHHFFLGHEYPLEHIFATRRYTKFDDNTLYIFAPKTSTAMDRERTLYNWYRQEIKRRIPPLLAEWEGVVGVKHRDWNVRKMKTRWGSCNINNAKICLNLELIKYPIECLEYVIVHELVHLHERHHNARFYKYMDAFMPTWKKHECTLESLNVQ